VFRTTDEIIDSYQRDWLLGETGRIRSL